MLARLAALASLALAACPPAPAATTGDTTSTSTTSTGAVTTTTGPDPGSTSTSTTTTTTTTTGDPPLSICDPQPGTVRADFTIDGNVDDDDVAYSHHCTVATFNQGLFFSVALADCKADPDDPLEDPVEHVITAELSLQAPLDLEIGEPVVLSVVTRSPWWSNRAFTLRRPDDELVLAGIRGDGLPGDPYGPPADYFAPLSLAMLATCPAEPTPELDSGCSFICGDCYRLRRGSMRLTWQDGATVDLIDRSTRFWPGEPYLVLAGAVEFHDEITCTDTPDRWARIVLQRYKH